MHDIWKIEDRLGIKLYFGGGGASPPPPVPLPAAQDAASSTSAAQAGQKRKGFTSTILTSGSGVQDQQSNKRTILGG